MGISLKKVALLVLLGIVTSVCGQQKGATKADMDPTDRLTRLQKQHFQAYQEALEEKKKDMPDRKKIFNLVYRQVVEWCKAAGPKYREESANAREKIAQMPNENAKKAQQQKADLYDDLYKNCADIMQSSATHNKKAVAAAMDKYIANERQARANRIPTMTREWLTLDEAMLIMAAQQSARERREQRTVMEKVQGQQRQQPVRGNVQPQKKQKRTK